MKNLDKPTLRYSRSWLAAWLLCSMVGAVSAATKPPPLPTPKAGLWQSQNQLWIDGRDVVSELKQQQQSFIGFLPKAQQAQVQQMIKQRDPTLVKQCFTPQQVSGLTTPTAYLRLAQQRLPKCQLRLLKREANQLFFAGQCQNQHGFTGALSGTLQVQAANRLHLSLVGTGRALVPGYSDGRSQSQFRVQSQVLWQSPSC